jgi:hypothetical protein
LTITGTPEVPSTPENTRVERYDDVWSVVIKRDRAGDIISRVLVQTDFPFTDEQIEPASNSPMTSAEALDDESTPLATQSERSSQEVDPS